MNIFEKIITAFYKLQGHIYFKVRYFHLCYAVYENIFFDIAIVILDFSPLLIVKFKINIHRIECKVTHRCKKCNKEVKLLQKRKVQYCYHITKKIFRILGTLIIFVGCSCICILSYHAQKL